jgi:signal transduction histidine kinase
MSDGHAHALESQRQLSLRWPRLEDPDRSDAITAEFAEAKSATADAQPRRTAPPEAVLASARSTPGEEKRRVDLSSLIESVRRSRELGLPVEVDVPGAAPCLCRPNEIRRAIRNLIENAARYGGSARVSLKNEASFLVATVDDDGAGIPEERLEEVFEPFVRLEASRNSATGGAGLGLTLARSIAREHGGDVILETPRRRA